MSKPNKTEGAIPDLLLKTPKQVAEDKEKELRSEVANVAIEVADWLKEHGYLTGGGRIQPNELVIRFGKLPGSAKSEIKAIFACSGWELEYDRLSPAIRKFPVCEEGEA